MPHQENQTTLENSFTLHGRGLHGGVDCRLTLLPAPAGHGVRFVRVDIEGAPEIPAHISALTEESLMRQTILRAPENPTVFVSTIEHILASLHAYGIDNVRVEMTAEEAPIWDGSAEKIARAIETAGIRTLPDAARKPFIITRPVSFSPKDSPESEFVAWPSEHLTITYFLEYDHPLIGSRNATFRVDPETFLNQIAPARTFCLYEEVEFLRSKGLIRGGDVNNAIIFGRDKILNTTLLWENETARHKLLDLLGDLYLLGAPVRGHFTSHRGGHHANAQFVDYLRKEFQ